MHVFVDESIHVACGFMLLAYVLCEEDPQRELDALLRTHGATEHHSLKRMAADIQAQELRSALTSFAGRRARWAVQVLPNEPRYGISDEIKATLLSLAGSMRERSLRSVAVDRGLIKQQELASFGDQSGLPPIAIVESHVVHGIQLADLVAALSGVRLREEVSGNPKMLTYGADDGYEPPIQAPLGFELWATLRHSMHCHADPMGSEMPDMADFRTEGCGLFVSSRCSDALRAAAIKLFGHVYLGCIH